MRVDAAAGQHVGGDVMEAMGMVVEVGASIVYAALICGGLLVLFWAVMMAIGASVYHWPATLLVLVVLALITCLYISGEGANFARYLGWVP